MYDDEISFILVRKGYISFLSSGLKHVVSIPGRFRDGIGVPYPKCGTG